MLDVRAHAAAAFVLETVGKEHVEAGDALETRVEVLVSVVVPRVIAQVRLLQTDDVELQAVEQLGQLDAVVDHAVRNAVHVPR